MLWNPRNFLIAPSNKRRYEILAIEGHYESDILEGNGSISYTNGEKLICMFVGGVPNGPAKLFDSENHIKQVITLNMIQQLFNLGKNLSFKFTYTSK